MKKPLIVELVGVSGSGKTTFLNKAHKYNKQFDNVEIASLRGLLFNDMFRIPAKKILRHIPMRFLHKLKITKLVTLYQDQVLNSQDFRKYQSFIFLAQNILHQSDKTPCEKALITSRFIQSLVFHYLINCAANKGRIVLADEFFLQKNFMFNITNNEAISEEDFFNYLESAPLPDAVIFFDETIEVCLSRIKNRNNGQSNYSELDDLSLRKRLTISRNYCFKSISYLEKKIPIFFISENRNNTKTTLDTLLKLL